MSSLFNGVLIGLSLFIMGAITQPPMISESLAPRCSKLQSCEDRILCRLNFYSDLYVRLRFPYVWGGSSALTSFDCSGYVYWCCKMAGLPVHRTTSYRMWLDRGSWPGDRVFVKVDEHDLAKFPDLLFWTYPTKDKSNPRPFGHVAFTVWNAEDKQGRRTVLFREASFSSKVVKETEMKKNDYRWTKLVGILVLDLSPGFDCGG